MTKILCQVYDCIHYTNKDYDNHKLGICNKDVVLILYRDLVDPTCDSYEPKDE